MPPPTGNHGAVLARFYLQTKLLPISLRLLPHRISSGKHNLSGMNIDQIYADAMPSPRYRLAGHQSAASMATFT